MKYDIIYDDGEFRFTLEKCYGIDSILTDFCLEFASEFSKTPEVESIILGINCWKWLTLHPQYNISRKTYTLVDLVIPVRPDWTVHPNYIELNLK